MLVEVLAVPAPDAVNVCPPAVIRIVLKNVVPEINGRFPGLTALGSVVTTLTVAGLLDVVTFQYWSTAFTLTENGAPAVTVKGTVFLPAGAVSFPPELVSGVISTCRPTVLLGPTLIPVCNPWVTAGPATPEAVRERLLAILIKVNPLVKVCTPASPEVKV